MKSYVISVSLGTGCYRHIQISASATLHKLHKAIINAFDFDDDHLYAFFMDNHYWSRNNVFVREKMDSTDRLAKNCKLERLGLSKGDQFKYIFDFGDEWRFQCKVLRELDVQTDIPGVIRRVGESPGQYPDWDEEDWDGEDWDEDQEDDEDQDEDIPKHLTQEEIDALYSKLSIDKETVDLIHKYTDAAANLYGLISLAVLQDIYNSQNPPLDARAFLFVAVSANRSNDSYMICPRDDLSADTPEQALIAYEIVANYLLIDNPERDIRELRNGQRGKTLKQLPKEEFLKYAEPDYYPATPQRTAMLKYLRKRAAGLSMTPDTFCNCLQSVMVVDAPTDEIFQLAGESGLTFSKRWDIGEFAALYQDLSNHTHKHVNRGHTPDELFMQSPRGQKLAERIAPENHLSLFDLPVSKPNLTLVGIPARNAPCPCGSGRKYKNCCGK